MNIAITGHKGLIGSSLLRRLNGHIPVLLVDKSEGKDILDIGGTQPIDMMIHLAAFCKINKSIESPEILFNNNVVGTHRVLELCRVNKIPKIIFASSSRVLSDEKNPYTASKIYGEELVKSYYQCYGIKYVIVRPSAVYGPFNDKTSRLIDIWMLNALQGKELPIYGDKDKTLGFTYIDDFIEGMLLAMNQENEEYEISSGESIKIESVADMIIALAGKGEKRFYPAELSQPQRIELDISKIKSIGYVPKTSIKEGIIKTFNWYRENLKEILNSREESRTCEQCGKDWNETVHLSPISGLQEPPRFE